MPGREFARKIDLIDWNELKNKPNNKFVSFKNNGSFIWFVQINKNKKHIKPYSNQMNFFTRTHTFIQYICICIYHFKRKLINNLCEKNNVFLL